jgi:hypothetical protein
VCDLPRGTNPESIEPDNYVCITSHSSPTNPENSGLIYLDNYVCHHQPGQFQMKNIDKMAPRTRKCLQERAPICPFFKAESDTWGSEVRLLAASAESQFAMIFLT